MIEQELQQLKSQVATLTERLNALSSTVTIPWAVDQAFRDRLLGGKAELVVSSKATNSEDVTVNESGSATYAVMDDPDGFLEIKIDGTTYYLPFFL